MASSQRDFLAAGVSGIIACLRASIQSSSSNSSAASPPQSVQSSLVALFPQCGERSSGNQNEQHDLVNNNAITALPKFDPRSKDLNSKKWKRKQNNIEKKEYHFAKDIILKDVVLLPSPDYKKVPRGKCWETLYAEDYVASAIDQWSQEDAIRILGSIFQEKLKDLADPRYDYKLNDDLQHAKGCSIIYGHGRHNYSSFETQLYFCLYL